MALLDWEKAFDKIIHERMFDALRSLNIDEHIINVLKNCYKHPMFFVQDEYGKSEKKTRNWHKTGMPTLTIPIHPSYALY